MSPESPPPSPRRSRVGRWLWLSLLLHLGLVFLFARVESPPPARPTRPVEWTWVERAAPVPSPAPAPPVALPPRPRVRSQAPVAEVPSAPASPPTGGESKKPEVPPTVFAPKGLVPSWDALPLPDAGSEAPKGKTLHPGDPELSPEALAQEEAHRVESRLRNWSDDIRAENRARGPEHPYWGGMAQAFRDGLARAPGGSPGELGTGGFRGLTKQYLKAAEEFARTGMSPIAAPSKVPTQSERQREVLGNTPESLPLRTLTQARETLDGLKSRGPLFTVRLELNQSRNGEILRLELLQGSGNQKFDSFVIRSMPEVVRRAGSPPSELFRQDTLRTQWSVEGWLRVSDVVQDKLGLSTGGMLGGIPTDLVTAPLQKSRFEFSAHLLRWY